MKDLDEYQWQPDHRQSDQRTSLLQKVERQVGQRIHLHARLLYVVCLAIAGALLWTI